MWAPAAAAAATLSLEMPPVANTYACGDARSGVSAASRRARWMCAPSPAALGLADGAPGQRHRHRGLVRLEVVALDDEAHPIGEVGAVRAADARTARARRSRRSRPRRTCRSQRRRCRTAASAVGGRRSRTRSTACSGAAGRRGGRSRGRSRASPTATGRRRGRSRARCFARRASGSCTLVVPSGNAPNEAARDRRTHGPTITAAPALPATVRNVRRLMVAKVLARAARRGSATLN